MKIEYKATAELQGKPQIAKEFVRRYPVQYSKVEDVNIKGGEYYALIINPEDETFKIVKI